MAYRDDGFGSSFGMGVEPRGGWSGGSRGVMREPSRIRREHDDEQALHPEHRVAGYPGYAQGPGFTRGQAVPVLHGGYLDHQNEHPDWRDPRGFEHARGTDMGLGEPLDRGPHYGKGPKGYRRSDERIREEACERIARQGFIDASDVEVHVENAVIRLTGTVASRPEKRGLEQLLERVHGVEEITNEIRIRRDQG